METSSRGALAFHIVRAISTLYNSKQVITYSKIKQLFYHTRSCIFVISVLFDVIIGYKPGLRIRISLSYLVY